MCLKLDKELTTQIKGKDAFIAYKVYNCDGTTLYSVYQGFKVNNPGTIEAREGYAVERVRKPLNTFERAENEVHYGIHVYLRRGQAQKRLNRQGTCFSTCEVLVPVQVHAKHMRAAGYFGENQSAVFTRITISPQAFKRACQTANKKLRERSLLNNR